MRIQLPRESVFSLLDREDSKEKRAVSTAVARQPSQGTDDYQRMLSGIWSSVSGVATMGPIFTTGVSRNSLGWMSAASV